MWLWETNKDPQWRRVPWNKQDRLSPRPGHDRTTTPGLLKRLILLQKKRIVLRGHPTLWALDLGRMYSFSKEDNCPPRPFNSFGHWTSVGCTASYITVSSKWVWQFWLVDQDLSWGWFNNPCQESGGLHQSAVASQIYQNKCQTLLPCLLSEHPFPALQMFTSENLIMGY